MGYLLCATASCEFEEGFKKVNTAEENHPTLLIFHRLIRRQQFIHFEFSLMHASKLFALSFS